MRNSRDLAVAACFALAGALLACGGEPALQMPFTASDRHRPKKVMGRDYWSFFSATPYTDPYYATVPAVWKNPWNNSSLTNLPMFRDSGIVRHAVRQPPDPKGTSASWRTIRENCQNEDAWNMLEYAGKKDVPYVLVLGSKRNVCAMIGDVDLDYDDWEAFKKANPNLICTRTMCEWGNDLMLNIQRTPNVLNEKRRKDLEAVWAQYKVDDRYDRLALCRWYTDRKLKLHYDDMDTFMAFRGTYHLDHVAAAWGAKFLVAETTNTTGGDREYRWDVSGMFIRGAARQFGLPWVWYEACYFNGYAKDGTMRFNSVCNNRWQRGEARPEGGTSASAQRRCWYYAYLNGANGVESESASSNFFTTNTPTGKAELSVRGRNFNDFHNFTAAHPDRGVTYAPVAILTPFAQGYMSPGGPAWGRCPVTPGDYALEALFFTIAPGWERKKGLKAGIQDGNLHNSRFAMMYDVLVPDSPQPREEFAKALFAYPAAILVGDYKDAGKFEDLLAAYERAGGRLVRITADELPPYGKTTMQDICAGRVSFPSIERKLEVLQRDLFPFEVVGDCQFGVNRTADGWWLWVFNNKGVRKFADTFERIDHKFDVIVTAKKVHGAAIADVTELVTGKKPPVEGDSFSFQVPAGDFAVFAVR